MRRIRRAHAPSSLAVPAASGAIAGLIDVVADMVADLVSEWTERPLADPSRPNPSADVARAAGAVAGIPLSSLAARCRPRNRSNSDLPEWALDSTKVRGTPRIGSIVA